MKLYSVGRHELVRWFAQMALVCALAATGMAGAAGSETRVVAQGALEEDAFLAAEPLFRKAAEAAAKEHGPDSSEVGILLARLAYVMARGDSTLWSLPWTMRRHTVALPIARHAVAILERTRGVEDAETAKASIVLAHVLAGLFRHPEGDPYARRALATLERLPHGQDKNSLQGLLAVYADDLHIVDHNVEGLEFEDRISLTMYGRLIDPPAGSRPPFR